MAAVIETIKCSSVNSADYTLESRGFSRTTPKRVMPSHWMNGANQWATVEKMPSGSAVILIGVSTL